MSIAQPRLFPRRRRAPSRARIAARYVRVLVGEFRGTLAILSCAVIVGTILHLLARPAGTAVQSQLGICLYGAWMALFAQPMYSQPGTWYLMIVYAIYPVLGFMLVGEGVVRLALLMISRRQGEKEWMQVLASTQRDHVVLCGLGHLGYRVLEQLLHGQVPVVVLEKVENNPFVTQAKALKVPVLIRDMKEDQALIDAGIERATAIIICSNDDISNLEVAIDSRRMNPRIRIVMRLFEQQLVSKIAGALTIDAAFSSSALAAPVVAAMSLHTSVLSSMSLDGETYVAAEVFIEDASPLIGKSIGTIESQYDLKVLARRPHQGAAHSAPTTAVLAAGDTLIVHVAASHLSEIASAGCHARR
jgi:Trk K+ transport system NAD-binding subunit